jgi:hypothetical protein
MIVQMLSMIYKCRKVGTMSVVCHYYFVDSILVIRVDSIKQSGVVHQLEQQQQQQQQQRKEQEKKKKAAAAAKKAKESSQKGSVKKGPAKKSSASFTAPDSSDSDSYCNSDSDEVNTANNNNKNSTSAGNDNGSGGDSDGDWSDEHAEAYDVDGEVDQTESEEPQSYLQQLRRTKALLQDEKLWLVSVFGPTVDPNSTINTVFGSSSDSSGYDNMYSNITTSQRRKVSSPCNRYI